MFLECLECAQQVDFSKAPDGVEKLLCCGSIGACAADEKVSHLFEIQLRSVLEQERDSACDVGRGLAGSLGDVVGGCFDLCAKRRGLCA